MKTINLSEQNSVLSQYMAEIRDIEYQKNHTLFRNNIRRIGEIMAYEISKAFTFEPSFVETPLGTANLALPKDKVVALVRECEQKGIPWGLQTDNSDTRLVPDQRFDACTHDIYLKNRIVPGLDPENYEDLYKMYVACPYPQEFTLDALKGLPWCRYHKEYFFVEPADKAFGIRTILDHFHARYEDAIVFGDALNDLSMFTPDGWTKVAMGNAAEEVKQKADFVTTAVDQDGIYNACL